MITKKGIDLAAILITIILECLTRSYAAFHMLRYLKKVATVPFYCPTKIKDSHFFRK